MSRPHGASLRGHKGPERIIKAAPSFVDARRALVATLENLSFVKVVSVQMGPRGAYTGEAVETHFRDAREKPKLVFFDKFGRSRSLLKVGPMSVAQAPLGAEHPSAVPTVGEVLVGSLVPNARKSHLEHVLRGWSSDAKPLWELLRILKYGTKASEFECRSLLVQPAAMLLQSPPHIKATRDDIYMVARAILWGSVRPLQLLACSQEPDKFRMAEGHEATAIEADQFRSLTISSTASQFMDALMLKFNDAALAEALQQNMIVTAAPARPDIYADGGAASLAGAFAPTSDAAWAPRPSTPPYSGYNSAAGGAAGTYVAGYAAPAYAPASPAAPPQAAYAPASPPAYAPASPTAEPAYAPASPAPVAGPKTPTYALYDDMDDE